MPKGRVSAPEILMKRLLIAILLLMALGACSPPLNLNKTIQATNIYGSFIVSDKWVIDNTQLGRIAFSNDAQGIVILFA